MPGVAGPATRVARAADGLTPDTIAAVATPPGAGAVGVVRISGHRAGAIIRRLAPDLYSGRGQAALAPGFRTDAHRGDGGTAAGAEGLR